MLQDFILLLPCFVCLFWGITLLSKAKTNYRAQNILAVNLLITAIGFYTFAHYFSFDGDYVTRYIEDIFFSISTLTSLPLYIFYFKLLTDEKKIKWWYYLLFLPTLIIGGSTAFIYLLMGKDGSTYFSQHILFNYGSLEFPSTIYYVQYLLSIKLYNLIIILQICHFIIYAFLSLKRYDKRLRNFYSNMEDKSIQTNYLILICISVCSLLLINAGFISRNVYNNSFLLYVIFFTHACSIYILAYAAYSSRYSIEELDKLLQSEPIAEVDQSSFPEEEKENDGINEKKNYNPRLVAQFCKLMEEKKIFLKKDLRLDEVASMMHTNRSYISRLINEEFDCTFSEYINRCRIIYAQELMTQRPEMIQEAIAEQSGFLYVATFSRTFKNQTGMTPKEWLRSLKDKKYTIC